jgi:hypothetical protein
MGMEMLAWLLRSTACQRSGVRLFRLTGVEDHPAQLSYREIGLRYRGRNSLPEFRIVSQAFHGVQLKAERKQMTDGPVSRAHGDRPLLRKAFLALGYARSKPGEFVLKTMIIWHSDTRSYPTTGTAPRYQ